MVRIVLDLRCRLATLRVGLPHHSGSRREQEEVSVFQMRPGDLIFYTNSGGTINHVALYIGGGRGVPCIECKGWYQDFHLELPYPGEDRQCTGRLIPWKVNKNYLKESREKRQLFPALFFSVS